MSLSERHLLKHNVTRMFFHAFNNYERLGYGSDELHPISCSTTSTFGNYSLTLVDSLDALYILGETERFLKGVVYVVKNVDFRQNKSVSTFETNIRILGGLLSTYLILNEKLRKKWKIGDDDEREDDDEIEDDVKIIEYYISEEEEEDFIDEEVEVEVVTHKRENFTETEYEKYDEVLEIEDDKETNENFERDIFRDIIWNIDTSSENFTDVFKLYFDEIESLLLEKIVRLGDILLEAFGTPTRLPFGSVNLKYGVAKDETRITSTASCGTFLLEFGVLSAITNDAKYVKASREALLELYERRDEKTGMIGNHIHIFTGKYTHRDFGIGAGLDSYFEYLIKGYLLFGNEDYLYLFSKYYETILKYVFKSPWYVEVEMASSKTVWTVYNSLQSFWPGVQSLVGDISKARKTLDAFFSIWRKYGATPEGYNVVLQIPQNNQKGYPLRPELAESIYHMYRRTKDPVYLFMGKDMIYALERNAKVQCGYSNIRNVQTKVLEDKMESFFLSETLKYLYLLFDENNFVNREEWTFNTEAHVIPQIFDGAHGDLESFFEPEFSMKEFSCDFEENFNYLEQHLCCQLSSY